MGNIKESEDIMIEHQQKWTCDECGTKEVFSTDSYGQKIGIGWQVLSAKTLSGQNVDKHFCGVSCITEHYRKEKKVGEK